MTEERARKMRKLVGESGGSSSSIATTGSFEYFECARYIWWASRQESVTKSDRKFMTRRMALLYIAKRNSDALVTQAAALGKPWSEVTANARGPYAVEPNRPWDDGFLELSDGTLQEYGSNCSSVVNMLKPKTGTLFSFTSRSIDVTDAAGLLAILDMPWAPSSEAEEECRKAEENKMRPLPVTQTSGPIRIMPNGAFAE
eukprot:CAMPEP_0119081278 /NCGR_PEP_ID=MMETSP1178-20130426/116151_1 /TAXON_ID=33656 /ORGANISM="unid sp, Strain CCMP2000" /LENGTH=199 /DNA_ID=CAMNT_0007063953 /DNA_START=22 /DNA_END=621 /DNA_ORIENTATION=+